MNRQSFLASCVVTPFLGLFKSKKIVQKNLKTEIVRVVFLPDGLTDIYFKDGSHMVIDGWLSELVGEIQNHWKADVTNIEFELPNGTITTFNHFKLTPRCNYKIKTTWNSRDEYIKGTKNES